MQVEILRGQEPSETAQAVLLAMEQAARKAGDDVTLARAYAGAAPVLMLFGVGAAVHDAARNRHLKAGGRVVNLDLGYFGRKKSTGYFRLCLDRDHPPHLLDATPTSPKRWAAHRIELREDAKPDGPVLLIGLGHKSRSYLNLPNWEADQLGKLQARFPGRKVIFRPKGRDLLNLRCETEGKLPIEQLLRGAGLVVCRHSNVAVDAAIAGVPFEAEDGAAMWLLDRPYTSENRLDFLQRLAHWQYRPDEADAAWAFAKRMIA